MSGRLTEASWSLLRDLLDVPKVVGYNHEIKELDEAGLIEWEPGWGYKASDAGRRALAEREDGE